MTYKSLIAISGLALLCTSASLAGSTGNGWQQRVGAQAPVATAHYTYCFGGLPRTAYFSAVFSSAPEQNGSLQTSFGGYLTDTLGVRNNGGMCFTSTTMNSAERGKKQREAELVWRKWTIVETKWTGNS